MTVDEWGALWFDALDVGAGTRAKYISIWTNHIQPKWGARDLMTIRRLEIKSWVRDLRTRLANSTVAGVVTLLSSILGEAVDDELLTANPVRRLRVPGKADEREAATAAQVARIAELTGHAELMVLTAAYSGLRWGEITGLTGDRIDTEAATLTVTADYGSLHEVAGVLSMGPPKSRAAVRTVHLNRSLNERLTEHLQAVADGPVFTTARGGLYRRSNFNRRVWRPAADAVIQGFHFHDLRHTHKTWMIEDGVPEVVQSKRLGHELGGVRGTYSHVTQPMIDNLLGHLQERWDSALPDAENPDVAA